MKPMGLSLGSLWNSLVGNNRYVKVVIKLEIPKTIVTNDYIRYLFLKEVSMSMVALAQEPFPKNLLGDTSRN